MKRKETRTTENVQIVEVTLTDFIETDFDDECDRHCKTCGEFFIGTVDLPEECPTCSSFDTEEW